MRTALVSTWALLALVGCGRGSSGVVIDPSPPAEALVTWTHAPVELDAEEPVLGTRSKLTVAPVPEGATVTVHRSYAGMTIEGCPAGVLSCIVEPEPVAEPVVADASGKVSLELETPLDALPRPVWFQAELTGPEPDSGTWSEVIQRDVSVNPAAATVSLRDVTAAVGLPEMFTFGNTHTGGVAWLDYNGDHWPDLFVTNGSGFPHRLFRNDGGGAFTPVQGLAKPAQNMEDAAACFADIDNDGDVDLLVPVDNPAPYSPLGPSPFEGGPNLLYVNQGDGTFTEEAAARGIVDPRGWRNITCTFADFDADGWVDLHLGNWAINNPPEQPRHGRLLLNDGTGHFVDSGAKLGHGRDVLATLAFDMDLDGMSELYLGNVHTVHGFVGSNPASDDVFYRNDGGALVEVTADSPGIGDDAWAAMALDVGDIDNDGDFDLYETDRWDIEDPLPRGNPLYVNRGDGTFTDNQCDLAGVCTGHNSWPATFADFDGDGWIDLWVGTSRRQSLDLMYVNRGDGTFESQLVVGLQAQSPRGGATADFDGDGAVDIALWSQGAPSRLLRNDDLTPHHWLEVELVGRSANRLAIGAVVRLVAGKVSQLRRVSGGDSAHSQSSNILHFGLGAHDRAVDLEILWPGGAVQQVEDVAIDRFVIIDQQDGLLREELLEASATWTADGGLVVAARSNYGGRTSFSAPDGALAWDADAQEFRASFALPEPPPEIEVEGRFAQSWVLPVIVPQ